MDLGLLTQNYMPLVVIACLVVGYCIKHISWLDKLSNEYIPSIMAILGLILGCLHGGLTLENAIYGALSGLVSTGLHQTFKQLVNKFSSNSSED